MPAPAAATAPRRAGIRAGRAPACGHVLSMMRRGRACATRIATAMARCAARDRAGIVSVGARHAAPLRRNLGYLLRPLDVHVEEHHRAGHRLVEVGADVVVIALVDIQLDGQARSEEHTSELQSPTN